MSQAEKRMHETVYIPVSAIDPPENPRPIKKKKVEELKTDIAAEGLLQDIGVRLNPKKPGRYIRVFGGHRLEACKQLGFDEIGAKLLDMDEEEATMAMNAENLFRNELDKEEYYAAVAEWAKVYKAKHPEVQGAKSPKPGVAKANKSRGKDEPKGTPDAPLADEPQAEPEPEAEAPQGKAFAKVLAEATGQSPTQAKQAARIATKLDDDQRAALIEKGVPQKAMSAIASIADPDAKAKAVNLIASGMNHDVAIAAATAPENATIEAVAKADAPGHKPDAEMSDEEWLDTYCGDVLAKLKFKQAFKVDAILWRQTREARSDFRNKTKKPLAQSKTGVKGAFHYALARVVNVSHPKDWPVCGPCGGGGNAGASNKCNNCNGNGYRLKTD